MALVASASDCALSTLSAVRAAAAGSPLLSCSCSPKYGALLAWIAAANAVVAPQRQQLSIGGGRTAPPQLQLIIGAAAGLWVQQAGGGEIGTKKSLRINFPEESTGPGGQEARQGEEDAAVAPHVAATANPHSALHCSFQCTFRCAKHFMHHLTLHLTALLEIFGQWQLCSKEEPDLSMSVLNTASNFSLSAPCDKANNKMQCPQKLCYLQN